MYVLIIANILPIKYKKKKKKKKKKTCPFNIVKLNTALPVTNKIVSPTSQ